MVDNIEAGKRYKVIVDYGDFFKYGDIVIALENNSLPLCIKEEYFTNIDDCLNNIRFNRYTWFMSCSELEEIKESGEDNEIE